MEPHTLSNQELIQELKSGSLDSNYLTHETLLNLSWDLLNDSKNPEEAIAKQKELLQNYQSYLTTDKSNDILVQAYIEILNYFKSISSAKTLEKLLREFPRIKFSFKNLLKTHYGYNILKEEPSESKTPLVGPIISNF